MRTIDEGTLTVAGVTYPPAAFARDGQPTGVDGDVVAEFAESECLRIRYIETTVAGGVSSITSDRADVLIGDWYRSRDRAEVVAFTEPLYVDSMALLSRDGYRRLDELVGKNVGTIQGVNWNEDMERLVGSGFKVYQSPEQMYTDLRFGRIDAGLSSFLGIAAAQKAGQLTGIEVAKPPTDERVGATIRPGQAGLVVNQDNPELLTALDDEIAAMREQGRLARILESHGVDVAILDTGDPYFV